MKQPGFPMESQAGFFWVAHFFFFASQHPPARKTQQHQVDHTKPIAYTEFINKDIGDEVLLLIVC